MKKTFIILFGGLLIAGGIYVFSVSERTESAKVSPEEIIGVYEKKEVKLGDELFVLEIADTFALQERGLSYRQSLAPQTGMLFVFDDPGVHYFWMKDMNFSIDIIWLDADKKVVHIEHSLSPSTYPNSFGPETPTQYVIEIPAGEAKSSGLSKGDVVSF